MKEDAEDRIQSIIQTQGSHLETRFRVFTEFQETFWSSESLRHPGTGKFPWITDAHGSKGCTRISADSVRHSGLRLQGRRGDAFGSVHGRPCNPRGMATRARSAQAGMPGCEEKCFPAFHPCASVCIRGFSSLLESLLPTPGFTQIREDPRFLSSAPLQSFLCAPLRLFFSINLHGKYNLRQGQR